MKAHNQTNREAAELADGEGHTRHLANKKL